ncbi:carbon-nitrogen hydrolase family protein [Sphingorhabdus sp. SMR4y]|uniref:carbon-nitrogen hydrolase family protein n=1 Tax=Sphingorhabdus sp. SMR4y TaxID=2584094 RepID=UPI000B5C3A3D|nr:carbon-nitrogen hydrolase family protein [Sphingorhabdus sp. SMR4y]
MKIALAQMNSGIVPVENADRLRSLIADAAAAGATVIFTPEMSGLLDRDRSRAAASIRSESDDAVLAAVRSEAKKAGMWVQLGSLAITSPDDPGGKWINRSYLINPAGDITARYDKIHLFDVDLGPEESQRESSAYAGGHNAVVAAVPEAMLGMSICYDLRFPGLYEALTNAGADILSVPAAFTVPTGRAHWQILLRARAIEAGAFVVAAGQYGQHEDGRSTYGHSMVIDPWGDILLDMGEGEGLGFCDLDMKKVQEVRSRIPAVANRKRFELPVTDA